MMELIVGLGTFEQRTKYRILGWIVSDENDLLSLLVLHEELLQCSMAWWFGVWLRLSRTERFKAVSIMQQQQSCFSNCFHLWRPSLLISFQNVSVNNQ
jgi:hypothetical protein